MDVPNRHRRPDKVAKKYYFAPDVVELIETEAQRTGYPRNVVLEIMVRDKLGPKPAPVEEAIAAEPPKPKRAKRERAPIEKPRFDPFAG